MQSMEEEVGGEFRITFRDRKRRTMRDDQPKCSRCFSTRDTKRERKAHLAKMKFCFFFIPWGV